jgi:hypothetical protein
MDSFGGSSERSLREQGVDALSRGERERARELFAQATRQDPGDEQGWAWLARLATNDVERRSILEQGLALHPQSVQLRQALGELGVTPGAATTPAGGYSSAGQQTMALPRQYPVEPPNPYATPGQPGPTTPLGPGYGGTPQPGQQGYNPYAPAPPPGTNPYAAPAPGQPYAVPPLYAYPGMGGSGYYPGMPRPRPGCITAYAVLAMIVSLLMICSCGVLASSWPESMRQIERDPNDSFSPQAQAQMATLSNVMVPISIFFVIIGIVGVVMSIALFRGSRWGWWLATVSFASSVLSSLFSGLIGLAGGDSSTLVGTLISVAISGGLLAYFYSDEPLIYFELKSRPKGQMLAISFGCGLVLAAVLTFWNFSVLQDLQNLK